MGPGYMSDSDYVVTLTDPGEGTPSPGPVTAWKHSPGPDVTIAYPLDTDDAELKRLADKAFTQALKLPAAVKEAIKRLSGEEDGHNGLYLSDPTAIATAMNSIPGMAQTQTGPALDSGTGTAGSINLGFFSQLLGVDSVAVRPLQGYLQFAMSRVQYQATISKVAKDFGIIIGLVAGDPEIDEVATTVKYVYASSAATREWFVNLDCSSQEERPYEYSYITLDFDYDPTH
jgi:hypothetical protein